MCVLVMNIILNIIVIWALKKVNFGKTGGIVMGKKIVVITSNPRKNGNNLSYSRYKPSVCFHIIRNFHRIESYCGIEESKAQ